jgi:hypothetical protein
MGVTFLPLALGGCADRHCAAGLLLGMSGDLLFAYFSSWSWDGLGWLGCVTHGTLFGIVMGQASSRRYTLSNWFVRKSKTF